MRRPPTDPFPTERVRPFFWKTCDSCKQEFRREPGWLIIIPVANLFVCEKYLCEECAPTLATALAWRRKYTEYGPPPQPGDFPAPPPKRRH